MKRNNWSIAEQDIAIAAYLFMHTAQAKGTPFNKAELARFYVPMLNNRSKGSYEAKLMNISAVFVELGMPYVKGYVPLGHAQKTLKDGVLLAVLQSAQIAA